MEPIRVQTPFGPLEVRSVETKPQERERTEAEKYLMLALQVAKQYHGYSMAQKLGIYPA